MEVKVCLGNDNDYPAFGGFNIDKKIMKTVTNELMAWSLLDIRLTLCKIEEYIYILLGILKLS